MKLIEDVQFTCPQCGSHEFGSSDPGKPDEMRGHCHGTWTDAQGADRNCSFSWPRTEDSKYFKGLGTYSQLEFTGQQVPKEEEPRNEAEFMARWAVECAEWDAIGRELLEQRATVVVAFDISEEQRRRMAARGERSVIDTAFARKYVLPTAIKLGWL